MILTAIGPVICNQENDEEFNLALLDFLNEFRYNSRNSANWEKTYDLLRDVEDYSLVRYDQVYTKTDKTESEKFFLQNFPMIKLALDIFASLYLTVEDKPFIVSFKLNGEPLKMPEMTKDEFNEICPHEKRKNFTLLMNLLLVAKQPSKYSMKTYYDMEFDLVEHKKKYPLGNMSFQ